MSTGVFYLEPFHPLCAPEAFDERQGWAFDVAHGATFISA